MLAQSPPQRKKPASQCFSLVVCPNFAFPICNEQVELRELKEEKGQFVHLIKRIADGNTGIMHDMSESLDDTPQ